jgi:hypothetical protein
MSKKRHGPMGTLVPTDEGAGESRMDLMKTIVRGTPLKLYALLDGARDRRIYPLVTGSVAEWRCLYLGDLDPQIEEIAPYLVELAPGTEMMEMVTEKAWGKAWGILCWSREGIDKVGQHFRRFARVKIPGGATVVFRYYDPRVLRVFLPTCDAEQLDQLFGPIQTFVMETGDRGGCACQLKDGALVEEPVDLKLIALAPQD